ncbi:MAG: hypothetical protein KC983_04305 [Phycisphaerales bacterium]|nr:hypothetical protein [Phycisphaerales bacterium]
MRLYGLIILLITFAVTGVRHVCASTTPFAVAETLPPDVTSFVHVSHPSELRRTSSGTLLQQFGRFTMFGDEFDAVWSQLAARAGVSSEELFDICFGSSFTMAMRDTAGADREWVVIGRANGDRLDDILKRLRPEAHLPRFGFALMHLPESAIIVARDGDRIVAAPRARSNLLNDTLRRMDRSHDEVLARDSVMTAFADDREEGRIAAWIRTAAPNPGAIGVVASIENQTLTAHVRGAFAAAPFTRTRTERSWDASMVGRFEHDALFIMMEPTDVDGGPMPGILRSVFGEPWPGMSQTGPVGDSRMFILSDTEGRLRDDPVDLRLPTLTMVVPTTGNPRRSEHLLDRKMLRITDALLEQARNPDEKARIVATETFHPNEARHIDLDLLTAPLARSMPLFSELSMNWQSIAMGNGQSAWVMATHPLALESTCDALCSPDRWAGPMIGAWQNVGTFNGVRLSRHLRSYADRPDLLADGEDAEAFREVLGLCADLTSCIDLGRWRLTRPEDTTFVMDVELQLIKAPSAGAASDD